MTTHLAAYRRRGAILVGFTTAAAALLMVGTSAGAAIVSTVNLKTAKAYEVLGHSTVTNTGNTVINGGNVGLWPGTSITGFGPGIVTPPGTIDDTTPAAMQAQADVTNAYTNAMNRPVNATTTADLTNLQLGPGVYDTTSHGALLLSGPLVLNGGGNANAVFIFQTNSTLTTASSSTVSLINGAQECNVFWQIGSSATLGSSSVFVGNILASASVTVNTGVLVHGRAFASTGAVTLDDDVFTAPTCALGAPTTTTPPTTAPAGTPTTVAASPGGGGTATTAPGAGTAPTLPGGGPALPGTPPGSPGVPGVNGPPRTGDSPLHTSSFPWLTVLMAGLLGTAALGGTIRSRRQHVRRAALRTSSRLPSRR